MQMCSWSPVLFNPWLFSVNLIFSLSKQDNILALWNILFANPVVFKDWTFCKERSKLKLMPCRFLFFHPAHGVSLSPLMGRRTRKSTKGAGEVEGSGLGAALQRSHNDELEPAHVCTFQLITHQQTPPISAIQAGQSHRRGMWSTRLRWYLVPSCFAAYVTDPFVTTLPPHPHPQIQHTCRCITQRWAAWDSLYLC